MNTMLCDFCNSPNVAFAFDASDFAWKEDLNSVSGWCACGKCAELVKGEEWDALAERSYTSLSEGPCREAISRFSKEDVMETIKDLHGEFRKHRATN